MKANEWLEKQIKEGRKVNGRPLNSYRQYLVQHEPGDPLPRGKFFDPFRVNDEDTFIQMRSVFIREGVVPCQ